jgi:alpha-L-arabinofuranosidase
MYRRLIGGTACQVDLSAPAVSTNYSFGHIPNHEELPCIDAMAVLHDGGTHLDVVLIHRCATREEIPVTVRLQDFAAEQVASAETLKGEAMYDQNTHDHPERIVPQPCSPTLTNPQTMELVLPPFSLTLVSIEGARPRL